MNEAWEVRVVHVPRAVSVRKRWLVSSPRSTLLKSLFLKSRFLQVLCLFFQQSTRYVKIESQNHILTI